MSACTTNPACLAASLPGFSDELRPWASLGVGLWLWDGEGGGVNVARPEHAFWQTLFEHSARFQARLRQLARQALASQARCCELEPHSGIHVICLPIADRGRPIGALLGCALGPEFHDDENLRRFCSLHRLDRTICERLTGDLRPHPPDVVAGFTQILRSHINALGAQVLAVRDIHDLSTHLAQAYEELNLIYRVSSNLTVLKRPAVHFHEVCTELLDVSVVQAFAAVLESSPEGEPQVMHVGPVNAGRDDFLRLYRQVQRCAPNCGPVLVINNVPADPALDWASTWLRQLVFFRLERQDARYGGLLALNHVAGADFGSQEIQLISAITERSVAFLENVRLYEDLEHLFMGMLHALVSSIDAKDPYTRGHSQRVAWLSQHLAELLELPADECRRIYLSGLLHDVGKIGVPEAVLRKTGKLTQPEFEEMKRHPAIGARILEAVRQIQDVIPGVLQHHERYDGLGYPRGLAGEQISLMGRVIGLADSFDAMTTSRTYRTAHPPQIAMAEIRRWSGTQFDPWLVDLLLRDDPARLLSVMNDSARLPLDYEAGLTDGVGRPGASNCRALAREKPRGEVAG